MKFDKIKDFYINNAFSIDLIISLILSCMLWFIKIKGVYLIDKENQVNILSDLISADVSLAGFILAALTIIVTFKSNIKTKSPQVSNDALDLLFNTQHYDKIVKVFKESIIELVFCMLVLFVIKLSSDNLSIYIVNIFNSVGLLITILASVRTLSILFLVLDLDKHSKNKRP